MFNKKRTVLLPVEKFAWICRPLRNGSFVPVQEEWTRDSDTQRSPRTVFFFNF